MIGNLCLEQSTHSKDERSKCNVFRGGGVKEVGNYVLR